MAELITKLCTTKLGILKWLQMLCAVISVLFLIDGRKQWWPYTLIFVCAIVLGLLSLATLLINFFMPRSRHRAIPLPLLELSFNAIATIMCLAFAVLLTFDFLKMLNGEYHHHRYLPPKNIGTEGWRNRVLVVGIAQTLAALCYGLSLYRANQGRSN